MKTLGLIHSTIRADEKLIIEAARKKNIQVKLIDIRTQIFNPETFVLDFDVALERSVSTVKGDYAIKFLENLGVPVVNFSEVAAVCGDKFLTSLALRKVTVPTPDFAMVFTLNQAVEAIKKIGGYPVVIKPAIGSWGRLLAKINDSDSLETVVEHKEVLGGPHQKAIYIQQYIEKPGHDIRAFVIGGKVICAIYRDSKHWITNTARGGVASNCPVTKELSKICKQASEAVGGGILAIDLFETKDGYLINEINHTMEFKNSEEPTGVSISSAIVDYCVEQVG
ncbi:lysine biosynthesis enzyme LysX [Candidatus Roizmanbacteria bacterium RIFCSPLOWO2_01_FULL_38_12]|uniref:Lysine biosynthesis enzyme LysX n=1 Tax=Candidatus Roizmanbacteria bacterium RIFCSPLOWO2_01_FULL_38_12 TaxID=1802061 RepID=A0A1F7IQW9_9BACT|nr:MAG: lysine biosynthesis enzyme LysX [Candidatus Roizmanbacteria bacterium RIFCSPHIGHO2_01_FULL_38_15]OGK34291.1 MAG: lysine biosynthesis enzyme LysX [Candidatus Roizmanbacteria bacterium RIFCSPHIGHO2_12_FULL_38_13]OGK45763.1 MAG: lysine biosynthesis enzyme LysX [Candidatus Roizmanbacteria bacterium RIFCSPLOWO2_01_FULL_38_12]